MGAAGGASAATGVAQSAGSLATGIISARAMRDRGKFERAQFELSARMLELQAEDEIRLGEEQANRLKVQARTAAGEQRASLAAQGIDVGSGTARDLRADLEFFADIDEATVRDIAWQRAFGARVQAQDYRFRGTIARTSARFNAAQSIIGGVNRAVDGLSRASLRGAAALPQGGSGGGTMPTGQSDSSPSGTANPRFLPGPRRG